MGACVARDDCEESVRQAAKTGPCRGGQTAEEDWYSFLLQQLQALQSDAFVGKVVESESSLELELFWEPAEEPAPGPIRPGRAKRGSPKGRLQAALSSFCMVEALEEVELMKFVGDELNAADLERTRRIGGRCARHLDWWATAGCDSGGISSGWPITGTSEALQLEWGFRIDGGLVHATFSTVVKGDLTKAAAALCELQLYGAFNDDFLEAEVLEEDGAANDSIWRLITHNKVLDVRADNIWQVSITDALDEPAGAVVVDLSVPEKEDLAELRGTVLPQRRPGFYRSTFGQSTYYILPSPSNGGQEDPSFRLVNHSVTRPAAKLTCLLSALPSFAQTRILRAGAERTVCRLKEHISKPHNKSLDSAMRTSPRAAVYEALREHLLAEKRVPEDSEASPERLMRFYSFEEEDLETEAFMTPGGALFA